MAELKSVRIGFYWTLVLSFLFGIGDRAAAVVQSPSGATLGLLSISSLAFVFLLFLKPEME